MVDQIGIGRASGTLLEIDAIGFGYLGNGSGRSGQANEARVKRLGECIECSRRIPFRIDSNEKRLNLCGKRRILLFQRFQAKHQLLDVNRANIRAKGIAKIDEPVLAPEIAFANLFSVFACQRKGAAHFRAFERMDLPTGGEQKKRKQKLEPVHHCGSLALLGGCAQEEGKRQHDMAKTKSFTASILLALAIPGAAFAQFSESYNFLKAVKDRDGNKTTEIISKPGNVIIDTRDSSTGETALHIVTRERDENWMRFLLARGAKTDIRDGRGNAPLMIAAQLGFLEGAQALLAKGANVDLANGSGETPLIRAVQNRNAQMVQLLMTSGANPNKVDTGSGLSAIEYAQRDRRLGAILKILETTKATKAAPKSAGPN